MVELEIKTLQKGKGSPVLLSVTLPDIVPVCENPRCQASMKNKMPVKIFIVV
jgi:hypothetical protein